MERTRREVVLGSMAVGLAGCGRGERSQAPGTTLRSTGADPLNVVLILTDDQRADSLGFVGHPFLTTPHLDRMAREGAHFPNAFVTTSLCCPSRASMLTGLYAHAHDVLGNKDELDFAFPTYATLLQREGVDTHHVGKWHMGGRDPHPRPGWKSWVAFRGQGRYAYPGPPGDPLDRGFSFDGEMKEVEGYVTTLLTDLAVERLRSQPKDRPFCLVLAHKAVHAPFVPRAADRERFAGAPVPPVLAETDPAWQGVPEWLQRMRDTEFGADRPYNTWPDFGSWYLDYHRTMLAVDDSVGQVLQALAETGHAERTVVLFTSDNGFMFGEKGVLDKRNFYEPSIRVPLLAWGPALVRAGLVAPAFALNVDIGPTILELLGFHPPEHWHGRSLVPLLRGETVADWRQEFVYEYFFERQFPMTPTLFGIRTKRMKYSSVFGLDAPEELFDLVADPAEQANLASSPDHADKRRSLANRLRRHFGELGLLSDPVWGRNWLVDGATAGRAPAPAVVEEEDEPSGEP